MSKKEFSLLDLIEYEKDEEEECEDGNLRAESTLCWDCQNAVPDGERGCPWSESLTPVPGWIAEKTKHLQQYTVGGKVVRRDIESYCVLECPMFLRDEPRADEPPKKPPVFYTDKEKARRAKLLAARRAAGLCKCGRKLEDKRFRTCLRCRKMARESVKRRYYERKTEEAENAEAD